LEDNNHRLTMTIAIKALAAAAALLTASPVLAAPALRFPPAPVLPAPLVAKPLPKPVAVAPLPVRPCFAGDYNPLLGLISKPTYVCRKPTAAEQEKHSEFMRALHVHGLKEKADKVCRVTQDIKLFNPYGGKWASQGGYIKAAAASPSEDWNGSVLGMDVEEYAHLVKDCSLGRMAQFAGHSAENQSLRVSTYLPAATASTGGPVFVRAHTRCNSSKCWPVRSYTRSR
jgi:hypothetical protein